MKSYNDMLNDFAMKDTSLQLSGAMNQKKELKKFCTVVSEVPPYAFVGNPVWPKD